MNRLLENARDRFDVVTIGEILVELYCEVPLKDGAAIRLGFSGDTLNAAAAAAAAGARAAVLTAVGNDELGEACLSRVAELGIDPSLIGRRAASNGTYLLHGDLTGHREFMYWRNGSAASLIRSADIEQVRDVLTSTRAVVVSGIFAALSEECGEAALTAARIAHEGGAIVVYDPNFRSRLATPERARAMLTQMAPYCSLMTPSCPGDAVPLLGAHDPWAALSAVRALGVPAVAVTSGEDAVLLGTPDTEIALPVPHVAEAVDATGAGDMFAGAVAARMALEDPLPEAVSLGIGFAALSVAGRGGTGLIPTLNDARRVAPSTSKAGRARTDL